MRCFCLLIGALTAFDSLGQDVQVTITSKEDRRLADGRILFDNYFKMESHGLFLLTADRAEYNPELSLVTATGNVKIDYYASMGLVEVAAQSAVFDLSSQAGLFEDVSVQLGDQLYFRGDQLEILNREQILITKGVLSACNQPVNHWSLRIAHATIEKEGYATIKGASFRVLRLPVMYFPFMWIPAFQERRSGILVPKTGSSSRNGAYLAIPFYWAPRGDVDMTFTPYQFQDAGLRADFEARYAPRDNLTGSLRGNYIADRVIQSLTTKPREDGAEIDDNRYRVEFNHRQSVAGGRLTVDVDEGSDFQVDRDFLVNTERSRIRDYYQRAAFSRKFGLMAMHVDVSQNRRLLANVDRIAEVKNLPSLRLIQPQTHLGHGFYLSQRAYLGQLDFRSLGPDSMSGETWRLGLEGELTRSANLGPYLHSRYGTGFRGVAYDMKVDGNRDRYGAYAFTEWLGPRLNKRFKGKDRNFAHMLDYGLAAQYGREDRDRVFDGILFDELDIRLDRQLENQLRGGWFIQSRIFVGSTGPMLPYLEVDLRQDVVSGAEQQPVEMTVRLGDRKGYYLNGFLEYDPDLGEFSTTTLYGSVRKGRFNGFMGYVKRVFSDDDQESLIAATDLKLFNGSTQVRLSFDYDFQISEFKTQELRLTYGGACVAGILQYVQTPSSSDPNSDRQWLEVGFSLRNLGELGVKF